jgi:glucose-1-phosphate thymidylyltransferase
VSQSIQREIIGLIPAAGRANRISPLPCSKELYPIGFWSEGNGAGARPKVVSQYLLEKMRLAGISNVYIVLRSGKWDIPTYFGDGSLLNMHVAYLVVDDSWGVPCTLNQAYPFVKQATVAFGFPDILFEPSTAFESLLVRQSSTSADVVLGLCRKRNNPTCDLVDFDSAGAVQNLILGSLDERLHYSWAVAVWNSGFTTFLHDYVDEHRSSRPQELSIGHAINASIQAGVRVDALVISEEPYLDIGTPDDLAEATRRGARLI